MTWVVLSFKFHQDSIAKEYCVNLYKPELACGGQCFLAGQLAKQSEDRQDQAPVPKPQKPKEITSIRSIISDLQLRTPPITEAAPCFEDQTLTAQLCVNDIFRPPKFRVLSVFA